MSSTKAILYLILVLALIRGLIYASVVPPWQAPDEPAQFERAKAALSPTDWVSTSENAPTWYAGLSRSLFTFGFWDFLDAERATYSPDTPLGGYIVLYREAYDGLYGSRPTYAMIGWPIYLAGRQNIALQLYLVRLNTVLMNVAIIFLAYRLTRTIFPQDTFLALGVPILILFNPQHTHMLSTVNNGNLAELLATAALYFMVRAIIKSFSWLNLLAILGLTVLAMWAKATAYFLPFAIGSIGLFYLWRYRRYWRWLLPGGIVLAGLIYLFAPDRLKHLIPDAWSLLRTQGFYLDPIVPLDLFRSFWALPGWFIFRLHPVWYQILAGSFLLALVGLMIGLFTRRGLVFTEQVRAKTQALVLLAIAILVAIGVLLAWNGLTHSIVYRQGRSIYPVIVPIALFLMLGWRQLIPGTWHQVGLLGITVALFLFDSMVLFHYIIPFFYSRY